MPAKEPEFQLLRATEHSLTVGTASTLIVGENPWRVWISCVVVGATRIDLCLGEAAVASEGIPLSAAGGAVVFDKSMPWRGAIYGISSVACVLAVQEVEVWH